jgi:cell division protein FtsQ
VFAGDLTRFAAADLDAFARGVQGTRAPTLAAVREAARRIPGCATPRCAAVPRCDRGHLRGARAARALERRRLVSARGEIFNASYEAIPAALRGPEAPRRRWCASSRASAARGAARERRHRVRVSPRGAWQVVLESGLVLELGRGDIHSRLARFIAAWPQLAAQGVETRHADLRYANGFALQRK